MKVAVLGANGQLGNDVAAAFKSAGNEVVSLSHQHMEVSSKESVAEALQNIKPDVVINTTAFHNVDKCEADPALSFAVNATGARNLAQVTDAMGATLFHISTDYVFDGSKNAPYVEQDSPLPLNVYGNSKLAGELFVRTMNPRHFVVRVSALYGKNPCRAKGGLNFVETMLKLAREREVLRVVDDEFVTPTPTAQVAQQLVAMSGTTNYGLYHATAEGSCSWYEFARAIFDMTGTRIRLERATPGEFPAKVPRPKYSVLENSALKRQSINVFTHWQEGLKQYLAQRDQPAPADR